MARTRLPPGAIPCGPTRVLLAMVRRQEAGLPPGGSTALADDLGLSDHTRTTVSLHVRTLMERGLVDRPAGKRCAAVPLLRVVAHTPSSVPRGQRPPRGRPAAAGVAPETVRLLHPGDLPEDALELPWAPWDPDEVAVDCTWCGEEAHAVVHYSLPPVIQRLGRGVSLTNTGAARTWGFRVEPCGHIVDTLGICLAVA